MLVVGFFFFYFTTVGYPTSFTSSSSSDGAAAKTLLCPSLSPISSLILSFFLLVLRTSTTTTIHCHKSQGREQCLKKVKGHKLLLVRVFITIISSQLFNTTLFYYRTLIRSILIKHNHTSYITITILTLPHRDLSRDYPLSNEIIHSLTRLSAYS